jgi:hypothetical protein
MQSKSKIDLIKIGFFFTDRLTTLANSLKEEWVPSSCLEAKMAKDYLVEQ